MLKDRSELKGHNGLFRNVYYRGILRKVLGWPFYPIRIDMVCPFYPIRIDMVWPFYPIRIDMVWPFYPKASEQISM